MEKMQLLDDRNWLKLGACEISCVAVYDHSDPKNILVDEVEAVNAEIKALNQRGEKPKSEIEQLREQVAMLTEKINNPAVPEKKEEKEDTEKDERVLLFAEAKEFGLTHAKNVKTDILKDMIAKAKEAKQ